MASKEYAKNNYPLKLTASIKRIIESGAFYVHGRDKHHRPIMVIRVARFQALNPLATTEETIAVVTLLYEFFKKHMRIPGRVENVLVVFDCKDMSYMKISVPQLKAIFTTMQQNYKCTSRMILVLNAPKAVQLIYNAIYYILDESVVKKI
jgi:hypothetical protein